MKKSVWRIWLEEPILLPFPICEYEILAAPGCGCYSSAMDSRLAEALERFDRENAADPRTLMVEGQAVPYELFYAQKLSGWVRRLSPQASENLLLAARCQHLCRWKIPRSSYEMNRPGYLKWRQDLKQFHAQRSGEILRSLGYSETVVERVGDLNLKKNRETDPECQVLEDALCLVTLEFQLEDLIAKTEAEKLQGILKKTWAKMSPMGREQALKLVYSESAKAVVLKAVAGG